MASCNIGCCFIHWNRSLNHLRQMDFSIKFHTVKSGWSIVFIEGLQVKIFIKKIIFKIGESGLVHHVNSLFASSSAAIFFSVKQHMCDKTKGSLRTICTLLFSHTVFPGLMWPLFFAIYSLMVISTEK